MRLKERRNVGGFEENVGEVWEKFLKNVKFKTQLAKLCFKLFFSYYCK